VHKLFKFFFILFFILISISEFASAQQTPVKKDSTQLYKKIESYSGQSKLKEFVYGLVFKPVVPSSKNKQVKKKVYKKLIQKPYTTFEGKIIRNINIVTLDPFGYSATDTTAATHNVLSKAGNKMHVKT
jgi:hypothetical protein